MSSVYATEPATSGRVIFETTHGPLEVQLWCRECPKTTKLFLQHCIDGFYDNMVFHRILPNFLIQTGALRDNNKQSVDQRDMEKYRKRVGADEALQRRKYELHSRLRFNHRGQVAMALGLDDDDDAEDLQPQFFITLDESANLDGKHVLFGTVSGPTVYNAIRISNCDVDERTNQPVDLEHAPKIKSVKILENPLHSDIASSEKVPWRVKEKAPKKKKKRKGKLDINVLSFGDEMDDGGEAVGIKSSHDILQSEKLSKSVDKEVEGAVSASNDKHVEEKRKLSKHADKKPKEPMALAKEEEKAHIEADVGVKKDSTTKIDKAHAVPQRRAQNSTNAEEKEASKKPSSVVEARRAKYVKGRAGKRAREEDTMTKLMAFQSKVKDQVTSGKVRSKKESSLASRMARRAQKPDAEEKDAVPIYHGQVLEDGDDEHEKSSSWLATKFKCRRHMDHVVEEGKELGGDGRAMDDYEVIDEKKALEDRDHSKHHRHYHDHHRERHEKHHDRRDETRLSHKY